MKYLCNEHYTILLKEIQGKNKRKDVQCSWIERINIVKIVIDFSQSVQSLSRVNSSLPHGVQHARPPCPSPTPRVYSDYVH